MTTSWTARSKKNTNRTSDRQVYFENVILAWSDEVGNYLNYDSTGGNNILVQKANNTDRWFRTKVSTDRTPRTPI